MSQHKHHHSQHTPQELALLIETLFPGEEGWQQINNLLVHHPSHNLHGNRGAYPLSEKTQEQAHPLLANIFSGPEGLAALTKAVADHPKAPSSANALNATGPAGPALHQDAHDALHELVKLVDTDPKATAAVIKEYGEVPAHDLEEQVQQVVALAQKHGAEFEKKFLADVAKYHGFDIGKIFQAIKKAFQTVGKIFKPIVDAIKKAVQKHKAAKAAQGAAANKPAPPKPQPGWSTGKKVLVFALAAIGLALIGFGIYHFTKEDKAAA